MMCTVTDVWHFPNFKLTLQRPVCEQDYAKTTGEIFMKLLPEVVLGRT